MAEMLHDGAIFKTKRILMDGQVDHRCSGARGWGGGWEEYCNFPEVIGLFLSESVNTGLITSMA